MHLMFRAPKNFRSNEGLNSVRIMLCLLIVESSTFLTEMLIEKHLFKKRLVYYSGAEYAEFLFFSYMLCSVSFGILINGA